MENEIKPKFNFKKLIIILGIIIVLNLFFSYGVQTFYKSPEFTNFCSDKLLEKTYQTKEECATASGLWTANQDYYAPMEIAPVLVPADISGENQNQPVGYCDAQYSCRKDFEKANDFYNRNVFLILVVAGAFSIVAGFLVVADTVSLGLSFGGLLSLIIGAIHYWSGMSDYLRFIILGLTLAVLIWFGIKKIRD